MGGSPSRRAPAPAAVVAPTPTPSTPTPEANGGFAQTFITNDGGSQPSSGDRSSGPSDQYKYISEAGSSAIPGMGDGKGVGEIMGGENVEQFFNTFGNADRKANFLGGEYEQAAEGFGDLPDLEKVVVGNQAANATGEGGENFGSRLAGNTDGVIEQALPDGSIEQTGEVVDEANSDLMSGGEIPLPGQAINNDVNYRLAANGGGGFTPGSARAFANGGGNISGNLMNKRTGFGTKFR